MLKICLMMMMVIGTLQAGLVEDMKEGAIAQDGVEVKYRWTRIGKGENPAMLLFLHGAGERGANNKAQLRHGVPEILAWLEKNGENCVVLAPQCPIGMWWANFEGKYSGKANLKIKGEMSPPMALVQEVFGKLAEQEGADAQRFYVTGLSMGGMGTFDLLARFPQKFAAAIPICGATDVREAKKYHEVPLWVFHGDADGAVPVDHSRKVIEALKEAGGEPKYTEYPGVGHNSWTQTYRNDEVLAWLFTQKKD
ncbi:MAG: prolyl oligopeptidase family serine peptidase [Verrucomicrobiales bacterium]